MGRTKETLIFVDTHIALWLYESRLNKFSRKVQNLLNHRQIYISPLANLELQYLYEVDKITVPPDQILDSLSTSIGLRLSATDFQQIIGVALQLSWTRDPFDRLLTAEAQIHNAYFVTADEKILEHYPLAVW